MGNNPASPHGGAQEELMARVDTSVPVSAPSTHRTCPRWAVSAESPDPRGPAGRYRAASAAGTGGG